MIQTARTAVLLGALRRGVHRPPAALEALQDRLLRRAVAHAWSEIPFYRRLWSEAGFDPARFRGLADLERIPIVSSALVKEAAERGELRARRVDPSRCTWLDSSGSSGRKLRVWKRPREERLRRAGGLRIWREHGFRWRDRTAQLQILPGPSHALQRLGVSRKTWISTARPLSEQLEAFLGSRADVLVGTATGLRAICHAVETAGARPHRPRIVFCAGELVDAETRETVTRVLGARPIALYGQTEFGYVAWQCELRQGLHVNADTHLVEVRRCGGAAGRGELGTLVTTDLRARTMPLLRYDSADLARPAEGPCPCGRTLPTLASVEGRASGALRLPDGSLRTTRVVVDHLAGWLRLGTYRLVQEEPTRLRLERVPEPGGPCDGRVRAHLRELVGELPVDVTHVPPFPPAGTGKTQAVHSPIPKPEVAAT